MNLTTEDKAKLLAVTGALAALSDAEEELFDLMWNGCVGYAPPTNGTPEDMKKWKECIEKEWSDVDMDESQVEDLAKEYLQ